jgi:hypothetical protein
MRALYATQKHIRVFVLGVPEGWHMGVYDLQREQWQINGHLHDTLAEAKAAAEEQVVALIGKKLPRLKWH